MTQWLELSVTADQEAAESLSELLAGYGHQGGVVIEPAWIPTEEGDGWVGAPAPGEQPPPAYVLDMSRPVVLRTYVPMNAQAEDIRQRVEQALWHLGQLRPVGPLQTRVLQEEDWANEWKKHYRVQRIGERIVIVPSWLDYTPQPDDILLNLDPGMAFGTGLHPTTRLCLQLLERKMQPSLTVLDVGTGSGILAIAAVRLGAAAVFALDNDPVAVDVARENVLRNGLSEQIVVELGSLGVADAPVQGIEAGYQLIIANIISHVLIALAHELATALLPGGVLITSGIIQEREAEVTHALAAAGLQPQERVQEGDWVALVLG
jgi:ribosomal protein L11 methyltransferase